MNKTVSTVDLPNFKPLPYFEQVENKSTVPVEILSIR